MRRQPPTVWLVLALLTAWSVQPLARAEDAKAPASPKPKTPAPAAADNAPAPAPAAEPLEFVRFSDDGKGGGTLDTAIATYENADGAVVHLVAAVHVGEKSYYSGLSETFDTYDALLYELVKPKDAAVPGAAPPAAAAGPPKQGGARIRGAAAIGGLQAVLKNAMELEFQLEAIDYDRPNFVHADLDAETFNEIQAARGESMFGLMLRSVLNEMSRQRAGKPGTPQVSMFDLLAAMASPDSARQYKLLLARQMQNMDAQLEGLEGEQGSVIISERNKAALRVLERTIAGGKKNVGVFYGAGHMRGLEDALLGEMGFKRTGVEWRVAWDMRTPAPAPGEKGDGKVEDERRDAAPENDGD
jgi:hypothetical protein